MGSIPDDASGSGQMGERLVGGFKIRGKPGRYDEAKPYDEPDLYDGRVEEPIRGQRGPLAETPSATLLRIVAVVVRGCEAENKNPLDLDLTEIARMTRIYTRRSYTRRSLERRLSSQGIQRDDIVSEAWLMMGAPPRQLEPK